MELNHYYHLVSLDTAFVLARHHPFIPFVTLQFIQYCDEAKINHFPFTVIIVVIPFLLFYLIKFIKVN